MPRPARQQSSGASDAQVQTIVLVLAVCALVLLGLVMVYSASSAKFIDAGDAAYAGVRTQAICAVLGIIAAVVLWRIPYSIWGSILTWGAWGLGVTLLVLTALMGLVGFGAQRWLSIGSFTLQPSEFAKIGFLLMMVRIVYRSREGLVDSRISIAQGLVLVLLPLVFLYRTQSDLGTTLICAVGCLAVMWIGGVSWRVILGIAAAGVAFSLFAIFGSGYRSDRLVYLDPWNDGAGGYGAGYNIIRAYYAIASGGLFGVGLGNSHEKFQYLFGSESDFIFAIIGEELGMVGALVVIALFLVVLFAGLRIASGSADSLGAMLAGGFAIMLVAQAFLNIGCTIGVLPTTGKPLPFISMGGSSIIASMMMVGMILSVSRAQSAPSIYEQRRADLRVMRR